MALLSHWQDARTELEAQGVTLPSAPSVQAVRNGAAPQWAHIGGGNLYRALHAQIAQDLIDLDELESGVTVLQVHDPFLVEHVLDPYRGSTLQAVLRPDGTVQERVLDATSQAVAALPSHTEDWVRAKKLFCEPGLQMVTVTITEKAYGTRNPDGTLSAPCEADQKAGPLSPATPMGIVAALLLERFLHGAMPVAMVSTDNFSHNGEVFRKAVIDVAEGWVQNGSAPHGFLSWLSSEERVSFPWTMVDRIVPGPSPEVAEMLAAQGWDDLKVIDRPGGAPVAGFVNCEEPWYLVVEDSFPNGRPALERAGVTLCSRDQAEKADTMKVCACLNPLHTALAVYGCLLDYDRIWKETDDPDLVALIERVGCDEGLPACPDPEVLEPKAFLEELLDVRLPNRGLPDAPQRIACDTSQKMPIRYGRTLAWHLSAGDAGELVGLPLVFAGWLRYLVGVDDAGAPFQPSPDPRLLELQARLAGLGLDGASAEAIHRAVAPILSDTSLFGCDLYEAGIGTTVERLLKDELSGPGAVRATLAKELKNEKEHS
ncbi:mannitol dehydrogenase family protein [Granulimonas faecalis]|uniref:mannitol dehydrogenase family protein n=1 Tax=Granulimonas faecalis TaxID=2894155 RepID=UPI003514FA5A